MHARISVEAVTQEIAEWQQKIVELKEQLAINELPADLKEQLQAFIPVSFLFQFDGGITVEPLYVMCTPWGPGIYSVLYRVSTDVHF